MNRKRIIEKCQEKVKEHEEAAKKKEQVKGVHYDEKLRLFY